MLRLLLDHVRHLEELIGRLGGRIEEATAPFAEAVERLDDDPRGGTTRGGDRTRGDRRGHESVPDGRAFGVVGGDVPGE